MKFVSFSEAAKLIEEIRPKIDAGNMELLDNNDQVIPLVGLVANETDPAWDRLCITGEYDVCVCKYAQGSLKSSERPTIINIAKLRECGRTVIQ